MTRTFSVALVVVMASASARAEAQEPAVLPSPLVLLPPRINATRESRS